MCHLSLFLHTKFLKFRNDSFCVANNIDITFISDFLFIVYLIIKTVKALPKLQFSHRVLGCWETACAHAAADSADGPSRAHSVLLG